MATWLDIAPTYEQMVQMYERLAEARKSYTTAQFTLEQKEYELKKLYPRRPELRESELAPYRKAVLDAKVALDEIRSSVQLLEQMYIRAMLELWYATVPRAGLTKVEENDEEM